MAKYDYDLIVIGTGAGGGVGANLASELGKRVAVVERDSVGGECPNYGCVPTKGLLYAAERYETTRRSGAYGIHAGRVTLNYHQVRDWKDLVVSRTGTALGAEVFENAGIDFYRGEAKFTAPHALRIGRKTYTAQHFLVATGSSVFVPPIPGLKEAGYITYREAIDFKEPPGSIVIIGGGPIGCEFAQIFSSFGSKVTIADGLPRLLGREDADAGDLLGAIFESRGIDLLLGSTVQKVTTTPRGKRVDIQTKHGLRHVTADEILIATGKRPVTQLGLEQAGVVYDRGGIKVDRHMRTSAHHIYAAGDVVGPYLFTHTGEYQSHIAAHNMFHSKKLLADYRAVPRCTYTSPEVASVGYTEEGARAEGIPVRVGAVPISIIGRANTNDEMNGFVKVVVDRRDVIIGAAIVSPRAGEMIHELTLAIKLRAKASEVAEMIHAFPTYCEAIKFACTAAGKARLS